MIDVRKLVSGESPLQGGPSMVPTTVLASILMAHLVPPPAVMDEMGQGAIPSPMSFVEIADSNGGSNSSSSSSSNNRSSSSSNSNSGSNSSSHSSNNHSSSSSGNASGSAGGNNDSSGGSSSGNASGSAGGNNGSSGGNSRAGNSTAALVAAPEVIRHWWCSAFRQRQTSRSRSQWTLRVRTHLRRFARPGYGNNKVRCCSAS